MINLENNTMDLDFFKKIRYLCYDNENLYKQILDSFSPSQFESKLNLIKKLSHLNLINEKTNIAVFACWFNSIFVSLLHDKVNSITVYDMDSKSINIGKKILAHFPNVKFHKADIFQFKNHKHNLANIDIVFNTSCEHMVSMRNWPNYKYTKKDTIFVFQSNNMTHIKDHINCVNSIEDFIKQLPLDFKVISTDEVNLKDGTRFSVIGKCDKWRGKFEEDYL